MTGGPGVAGVEADPEPGVTVNGLEVVGEVLDPGGETAPAPGARLDE